VHCALDPSLLQHASHVNGSPVMFSKYINSDLESLTWLESPLGRVDRGGGGRLWCERESKSAFNRC